MSQLDSLRPASNKCDLDRSHLTAWRLTRPLVSETTGVQANSTTRYRRGYQVVDNFFVRVLGGRAVWQLPPGGVGSTELTVGRRMSGCGCWRMGKLGGLWVSRLGHLFLYCPPPRVMRERFRANEKPLIVFCFRVPRVVCCTRDDDFVSAAIARPVSNSPRCFSTASNSALIGGSEIEFSSFLPVSSGRRRVQIQAESKM